MEVLEGSNEMNKSISNVRYEPQSGEYILYLPLYIFQYNVTIIYHVFSNIYMYVYILYL